MIKHDDVSDDALLLEKIKFEEELDNVHYNLSILDQSILLALCLDVKNDNPMDGLTGEQMGGFLARVLNQHDDWMVYATALLERAWLECERTHGRERAILQIQALADQHSNRLTLTQSTFKSVEEDSAPAQDRLRNLHGIVYPPRWDMMRDLAERYAKLGVVTSAAEIFEELELWDEVVECYRIAGKESKAEEVVRKRLAENETPRMYAALGDLTKDPKCFERSLELSHGKFYDAHVALGKYYFDNGDLRAAMNHFLDALATKPLMPAVWFRVGTISMQLKEWDTALRAFTEVVQQQPDEGDAWANVAAVYMYRRNPEKAYPALQEVRLCVHKKVRHLAYFYSKLNHIRCTTQSLKQNRNNWRVWVSKLYICIDLQKYDEAIQACNELLGLKARRNESEKVPNLEEKCIRAITGGSIQKYEEARSTGNEYSIDSSKRTLIRLRDLLDKMQETMKSEAWVYEVSAHLNSVMGWKEDILNDLMKEYRIMQSEKWEQETVAATKMVNLIKDIFRCHKEDGKRESLSKCKLLINGVKKKLHDTCEHNSEHPKNIAELDSMVRELDVLLRL
jgi:tetratricopeptide (TPR) repeat protein